MLRNFTKMALVVLVIFVFNIQTTYAFNLWKGFGGKILYDTAESITEEQETCESGGTCMGNTSNTWEDMSDVSCDQGTFSLEPSYPENSPSEYCVSSSAKAYGSGTISTEENILGLYTEPTPTDIGTCTCVSVYGFFIETTVETVTADLAGVNLFGTSSNI